MPRLQHDYNIHSQKLFHPRERAEELSLLLDDDTRFTKTKQYLDNLIMDALDHFDLSTEQLIKLREELSNDIPVAAKRFLGSEKSMSATYKFSTYFTWYIADRVNRIEGLQR
jgi:hypothetical protein